ncbi:uncharacterized protein LOC129794602 [Lutzomyia longipalpis]|uniref:uncharacterized protein LOC129794602 n=1 Tax=Lutzomyia longipalpis TaxID=7200 RepID=UPI00248387E6|nr:uncharacterized protein LOC129794602 [Lutzomyia longipalpis]
MNKNFLLYFAILFCAFSGIYVHTLRCFQCDSTELLSPKFQQCDRMKILRKNEENCIDEHEVCYRTVFYHRDDGIIVQRGCQVENICEIWKKGKKYPKNFMTEDDPYMVLECTVCNTDLCDAKVNPTDGWRVFDDVNRTYCSTNSSSSQSTNNTAASV